MVGKPKREQNQESIELIEALKKKLECNTDSDLAERLGVHHTQISRWKRTQFTIASKAFIDIIINTKQL